MSSSSKIEWTEDVSPIPALHLVGGFFDWWQIETPLGVTCWRSDGRVAEEVPKKWRTHQPTKGGL